MLLSFISLSFASDEDLSTLQKPSQAVIRQQLSQALSEMFSKEVPEYKQFTEIVRQTNELFLKEHPGAQEDSENRVLSEKHGAIRVGTAFEMQTVTRIFAVAGMYPVEFYDMTQLPKGALPMIATAFRPIDESIEVSPFRMFCSLLHPKYIPNDIKGEVKSTLSVREAHNPKFSSRLMALLDLSDTSGLNEKDVKEFVGEVVASFRINNKTPIHFDLYKRLREKNDVFADIVCLGINVNHLTPRAYDIQSTQKHLEEAGIPMKDGGIEGPPLREDAPNIQLNQTSRKAPGEPLFVSNDPTILALPHSNLEALEKLKEAAPKVSLKMGEAVGDYLNRIEKELQTHKLVIIDHKARFGEIESRGTALTRKGEELYKFLSAKEQFKDIYPKTHEEMFSQGLAYYTFEVANMKTASEIALVPGISIDLQTLLDGGYIKLKPQTYNDFLAASAAGIFKSNMSAGVQEVDCMRQTQSVDNKLILELFMGRRIVCRHDLHKAMRAKSISDIYGQLGIPLPLNLNEKCAKALKKVLSS